MKRFVIQKHTRAGQTHWDLMLEAGSVLKTYRVDRPPEKMPEKGTTAVRIFDHPLRFLTYEGSVNKGEGSVMIADTGTYRLITEEGGLRQLELNGNMLKGTLVLTHIEGDRWECSFS